MQRPKTPLKLIKKKIYPESIMYKFLWSNGSISLEPMTELTQDTLKLVEKYELQCSKRLIGNCRTPIVVENDITPIKEEKKDKKPCIVRGARQAQNNIEFQIVFKDDKNQRKYWKTVEQLKKIAPISLCDYLLDRVTTSHDIYTRQLKQQQKQLQQQY